MGVARRQVRPLLSRIGVRIQCPKCQVFVGGHDIELERGLAICRPCGEVIPLGAPAAFAAAEAPPPAYRPESLDWRETDGATAYNVTSAPRRLGALPLLFFAIFWNGFLVVWYANAVGAGNGLALLFPLLHVGAGIFITHRAIVGLFNTTRITVDANEFLMRRGPIPERGGHIRESLVDIEGFSAETLNKGKSTIHRVMTRTRSGRAVPMLVCEDDLAARFVAARLNDVMGRFRAGQMVGYR